MEGQPLRAAFAVAVTHDRLASKAGTARHGWRRCRKEQAMADSAAQKVPASDRTRPASDLTEPPSDLTRPASDLTEPPSDLTRPASELTEPASDITGRVLDRVRADSPRTGELLTSLITHLHEFVLETRPTPDEWRHGLDFLARTGQFCTGDRHEFILLSDILGLSSLVDELSNDGPGTPSTVEGPFHTAAPPRQMGAIIATGAEWGRGGWTVLRGTVTGGDGEPVAGATIDIWQSDDRGRYDVQDAAQPQGNLRALLTTGDDGSYWLRTVRPCSYPVPVDGTGGELLRAMNRHPMRPAHIHAEIRADGRRPLTTHLFVAGDEHLDSDAAFGVRDGLVLPFTRCDDPAAIARFEMPGPFYDVEFDFRLVPPRPGPLQ
jgi:catechol 1,2-dioxygenase